ncbi:hypothetical protein RI056_00980 [Komagataeibacter nataicola]|uniref:hypothetical protein n=1 Tax=Komagataeibacter nataicola TaxID=265960 RepID=UPI0028AC2011|nr:hypothetical protein [Komagataeibacter nataicola]WNM08756.1 hypothetical protein RI056_00980 [Komagataeibacter nataicola]
MHYTHGHWYGTPTRVLSVISPTRVDLLDTTDQPVRLDWPDTLTPGYLMQITVSFTQSISTMLAEQNDALPSSQSPSFFITEILGRIMLPVTFAVMLLLAVPVVYIPPGLARAAGYPYGASARACCSSCSRGCSARLAMREHCPRLWRYSSGS